MQKLIVVVGPTASGKSELAVFLARAHKGEIISADSRQVYKYLDVGTNKVLGKWRNLRKPSFRNFIYKHIRHYCIDFVHPRKTYTVAEYKIQAEKAITEIVNCGNVPILVGGTGLYIQAVADDLLLPEVLPNKKLRALLEKKSTEQLFGMLKKLDPERARVIDSKNPRRLIRAIEICKATGKQIPKLKSHSAFDTLFIGIKKSDIELKRALEKRSKKQIPGLLKEVRMLLKMHISKKRIREFGFEYRLALDTIFGSRASENLAGELTKENWRYAKRQMTWFKRDKRILWVENKTQADQLVRSFFAD